MFGPTVARVVWSSAISEPCVFAAVVRAQGLVPQSRGQ